MWTAIELPEELDLATAVDLVVERIREDGDISSADAVEHVRTTYTHDGVDDQFENCGDVQEAFHIVLDADGYDLYDVLAAHLG